MLGSWSKTNSKCPRCHRNNLSKLEKNNDSVLCNKCNVDLTARSEKLQNLVSKMNQKKFDVSSRMMQDKFKSGKYESFMNQNMFESENSDNTPVSMMCQNIFY